jgi:hypothetical protein
MNLDDAKALSERLHGYNPPDRTIDEQRQISVDIHAAADMLDAMREEIEELKRPSWAKLMAMLDDAWPAAIFPTLPDREGRDEGPRIVSLLRWVNLLREEVERLTAKLGPLAADNICLLCGRDAPCMTEADLKPEDPGIPCTFDPTPQQLWDDNQRLRAEVKRLEAKCALLAASWQKAEETVARHEDTIRRLSNVAKP